MNLKSNTTKKYKEQKFKEIIFGPILTRRLGYSLGIDLVPAKSCNMNCIYCECGPTTRFTNEYIDEITEILIQKELMEKKHLLKGTDYITLTGSGEPTLNPNIGKIINVIRKISDLPIALLTNATLLYRKEIFNAIFPIDVILPSLDAGVEKFFKSVNKPHPDIKLTNIIEGIKKLVESNHPAVWLEIMLVKNINDQAENILKLREIINYIKPHKVQLNTPIRPGTLPSAAPLSELELIKIGEKLNYPYEIISFQKKEKINYIKEADNTSFILNILERRPMTFEEIAISTGINYNNLTQTLNQLLEKKKIKKIEKEKICYLISVASENKFLSRKLK